MCNSKVTRIVMLPRERPHFQGISFTVRVSHAHGFSLLFNPGAEVDEKNEKKNDKRTTNTK